MQRFKFHLLLISHTHPLPGMPTSRERPTQEDDQKAGGRRETSQIRCEGKSERPPAPSAEQSQGQRPGVRKSAMSPVHSRPYFGFNQSSFVSVCEEYVLCFGKEEAFLKKFDGR